MKKKAYVFLAEGFEEIEALTGVDVLRRGGMEVHTVSITDEREVTGAHGVPVKADLTWDEAGGCSDADWLLLPGGLPGANNLAAYEPLNELLRRQDEAHKGIGAICAAPAFVLGPLGLLKGRDWTGYPGCEKGVDDGTYEPDPVMVSGNVVTGEGPALALHWALTILEEACGSEVAQGVADGMLA